MGGDRVPDKGLREVVAAETKLSDIDGQAGRLWYVGYDIHDLAGRTSYEEVVHLLHELRLPTQAELDALTDFMVEEREVSRFLTDLMPTTARPSGSSPRRRPCSRCTTGCASGRSSCLRTPSSPTRPTAFTCCSG